MNPHRDRAKAPAPSRRNVGFAQVGQRAAIGDVVAVARDDAVEVDARHVAERDRHGRQDARPFDHGAAHGDLPRAVTALELVDIASAGDPVAVVAVASGEQVVGLGVGGVAVQVAAVVEQGVVRRRLADVVQVPGPVIEGVRRADERAGGDLRVGVEGR